MNHSDDSQTPQENEHDILEDGFDFEDIEGHEEDDYSYKSPEKIDFSIITMGWRELVFFDDLFLNMQGINIGISDPVITQYEYNLLFEYIEIEKTPRDSAMLVSAFSQMWVFSLYELLRQWRDRRFNVRKWHENGGIREKIKHLSDGDELNLAKNIRRRQLQAYSENKEMRDMLDAQWLTIEPVYRAVELYRMNLAKHTAPGKESIVPRAPGYGRINMLCGAMDYELASKDGTYTIINRRDLADALRRAFLELP
ncbi:hypothetical protein EKD04_025840 [Chloroflexales bacterium ZM16-3]|nr:hypothetical protein [Chloroflexales bacterium ZM16-3]